MAIARIDYNPATLRDELRIFQRPRDRGDGYVDAQAEVLVAQIEDGRLVFTPQPVGTEIAPCLEGHGLADTLASVRDQPTTQADLAAARARIEALEEALAMETARVDWALGMGNGKERD